MLCVRVKVDLEAFAVVTVLDLTAYRPLADRADPRYDAVTRQLGGANLRGFIGGAAWGRYGRPRLPAPPPPRRRR